MDDLLITTGKGAVNNALNKGSGSNLIVWILLIVVLALVAFILIRDRRARQWLISLFKKAGNRIKRARINSKIDKLNENVRDLVINLGRETWKRHLMPEKSENVRRLISESLKKKSESDSGMEEINGKLDKINREFKRNEKTKDDRIGDLKRKKEPFEKKYKEYKDKRNDFEKMERSLEKGILRLKNSIEKEKKTLLELAEDKLLDSEERDFRQRRSEESLKAAEIELSNSNKELPEVKNKISALSEQIGSAESEIKKFEGNAEKIEEEFEEVRKKSDELKKELMTEKGRVAAGLSEVKKRLDSDFFLLGDLAVKVRPDDNSLSKLFAEIDSNSEKINNLKKELETLR